MCGGVDPRPIVKKIASNFLFGVLLGAVAYGAWILASELWRSPQ